MKVNICYLAVATALLAGCAINKEAHVQTQQNESRTQEIMDAARQRANSRVTMDKGIYLGDASIDIEKNYLPSSFNAEYTVNKPITNLNDFAAEVSQLTGIPVKVTPDASEVSDFYLSGENSLKATKKNASGTAAEIPTPLPSMGIPSQDNAQQKKVRSDKPILSAFTGSLKALMNAGTNRLGVAWKYNNGEILIYGVESKTFVLEVAPGEFDISNVSTDSGTSAGSTTSSQSTSTATDKTVITTKLKPWETIERNVKQMLSRFGSATTSNATNTVMVRDIPTVLDQVEQYVKGENSRLNQKVDLYVKIFKVSKTKSEIYGVDWTSVYSWLAQNTTATITGASSITSGSSFKLAGSGSSPWAGSSAIMHALATQGNVTEVTSQHVTPLNNRPAPVFVGRTRTYIKSLTQTTTDGVTTTTAETGELHTGLRLNLLPTILEKRSISLRFNMDITTLNKLESKTFGTLTIEMPDYNTQNVKVDTSLKSGETLVLAGFEQEAASLEKSGTFTPGNLLFGGSSQSNLGNEMLVITITAIQVGK